MFSWPLRFAISASHRSSTSTQHPKGDIGWLGVGRSALAIDNVRSQRCCGLFSSDPGSEAIRTTMSEKKSAVIAK
jgi:hypothetical protein